MPQPCAQDLLKNKGWTDDLTLYALTLHPEPPCRLVHNRRSITGNANGLRKLVVGRHCSSSQRHASSIWLNRRSSSVNMRWTDDLTLYP